jgi:hypothetical protein
MQTRKKEGAGVVIIYICMSCLKQEEVVGRLGCVQDSRCEDGMTGAPGPLWTM